MPIKVECKLSRYTPSRARAAQLVHGRTCELYDNVVQAPLPWGVYVVRPWIGKNCIRQTREHILKLVLAPTRQT